jgi:hypothetical protein
MRPWPAWSPAPPAGLTTGCRVPWGAWQLEAAGRRYLGFAFDSKALPCWPDRTRFAAFLTSPPRFHDGGGQERSVQRPLHVRAGQQGKRAQRGRIIPTRKVPVACGFCMAVACL